MTQATATQEELRLYRDTECNLTDINGAYHEETAPFSGEHSPACRFCAMRPGLALLAVQTQLVKDWETKTAGGGHSGALARPAVQARRVCLSCSECGSMGGMQSTNEAMLADFEASWRECHADCEGELYS